MKKTLFFVLSFLFSFAIFAQNNTISLAGDWRISYNGEDGNVTTTIKLPGSMLTNNLGNKVTVKTKWVGSLYDSSYFHNPAMERYRAEENIKFPFFLTPKKHFVGNAEYSRTVFVPKEWTKKLVILHLERPHIESEVFVNDQRAGHQMSLSAPHEYDITPFVKFGQDNYLRINIYNGIENVCVGQDSHSVTDQTQGNWNGITGKMEIQSRPKGYVKQINIFPDITNSRIRVELISRTNKACKKKASVAIDNIPTAFSDEHNNSKQIAFNAEGKAQITINIPNAKLWDEFTPNLYTLTLKLDGETLTETFGMRDIRTNGREMVLNNHPLFIRGTVGNCCFPLTGYPPTDEESWLTIFRKCKDYGLNMMRFHSYCPPEAAFAAADKVGFYLQPEGPSWPNHGVKLGNGMIIDRYLLEETQRMVEHYGNHPSFCMLAAGNEPAGNWVKWVGDFVDYWHSTGDNRRLYCGASVGGGWAFDPQSDYHVTGGARGLNWDKHAPQSSDDYAAAVREFVQKGRTPVTFKINEPYLSHEQGQWCAFPDFKEISQYTGAYKAGNFEIFQDLLKDNGMQTQAEKFLNASGKLQTLAYKYEIERNLRTPEYTGFQLLSLNDYSGQGTALVGVLNVLWKEKGYCNAKQWREFCSEVVPLAKFPKFVFTDNELQEIPISVYNAKTSAITNPRITYSVTSADFKKDGKLPNVQEIPVGKDFPIGAVNLKEILHDVPANLMCKAFTLRVNIEGEGSNSWEFWLYPSQTETPQLAKDVYLSDTLDNRALETLKKGGKVLLTAAGRITMGDDIKQHYLPVFWNTSWFKMRPPHITGTCIDNTHPLFKNFPTDNWANLNWWELLNNAQVINLQDFPSDYQPAIQPIDTWHISRKIGMMAETNIEGGGKLLVTTLDINSNLDKRPVARQMRKAMIQYINSDDFNPSITVTINTIADLYTKRAKPVNMFTNESPDELKPKLK